ncbi:MAG TPA: hypothetical protein V6D22_13670 [Candidatus Obscuribacterales bacterium]
MSPTHRKYSYRPFQLSDLDWMDLLEAEKKVVSNNAELLRGFATKDNTRKSCFVVIYMGRPLFIAGYYDLGDGAAQIFIIPDKRVLEHPKVFIRNVIRWRLWLERRPWCSRIQTTSVANELIDRWMEAMGFVCERELNQYNGTGQDYKLWSRVKLDGIWRAI